MPERRVLRSRASLTSQMQPTKPGALMSRTRRVASGSTNQSITVARATSQPPNDSKKSIRIRFKMPSSKLREVTSGSRKTVGVNSRDSFEGGQIMTGPRGSRAKRPVVVESESEEDEEDEGGQSEDNQQDEEDEGQEDAKEDEEEEDAENDDSADADVDADGDVVMNDKTPETLPPASKTVTSSPTKPSLTITPAQEGKVKSVEAKEMELADDDDEELSELESEGEEDEAEAEPEDAEAEEAGEMDEMDQEDEGRSLGTGSRASTPDVSKMTKRQRSRLDQVMGGDFLQLPMEPQIKKHLTAEEHAMRRAEMARRRKNLSEKRNEEEKMDTINRLLKKQAPKRRGKIPPAESSTPTNTNPSGNNSSLLSKAAPKNNGGSREDAQKEDAGDVPAANPIYVRWVSDHSGCRVGVPKGWLGKGVGAVF